MTTEQTAAGAPTGCPITELGAAFDPSSDDYQQDLYPFFARAREEEPVFYSTEMNAYVLTRYDDVMAALRDPETFSASPAAEFVTIPCEAAMNAIIEGGFVPGNVLVDEDDPEHRPHRAVVRRAFTKERLAELEERLGRWIPEYVDQFVKRGHADLVREFMFEIPALAAFSLLGVADEELKRVKTFAVRRTIVNFGWPSEEEQLAFARGLADLWQYCESHVERTAAHPNDSFLSEMIELSKDPANGFDRTYCVRMCSAFLFAGHETTTNGSANAFLGLLSNRDQWDLLCSDPSLIPRAADETLRYFSSAPVWRRRTTKPVTIAGVDIPANQLVLLGFASANRDREKFEDPDRLDVTRENARNHFSFGWGRHKCLGAPLARLELRMALTELTQRLPHMRLADGQQFDYQHNLIFRGPNHVYVEWDPSRNPRPEDRPESSGLR